ANKALRLVEAERIGKAKKAELEDAKKGLLQKEQALKGAQQQAVESKELLLKEKARDQERLQAQQLVLRLVGLTDKVVALTQAKQQVIEEEGRYREASQLKLKNEEQLNKLQQELEAISKAWEEAKEKAGAAPVLEANFKEAERLLIKKQQLLKLQQQLTALDKQQQAASTLSGELQKQLQQDKEKYVELLAKRQRGQAALLAAGLKVGEACPVCGSHEHPFPAVAEELVPTEEVIKAKEAAIAKLEDSYLEAKESTQRLSIQLAKHQEWIDEIIQELGANVNISILQQQQRVTELQKAWDEAVKSKDNVSSLQEQLNKLKLSETAQRDNLKAVEQKLVHTVALLKAAEAVVTEREADIPLELRNNELLQQAKEKAEAALAALDVALENARLAAEETQTRLTQAETSCHNSRDYVSTTEKALEAERKDFLNRLKEEGFDNYLEYSQAKRLPAEISAMEQEIKDYENRLSAAKDRLRRAEMATKDLTEPDITKLQQVLADASDVKDLLGKKQTSMEETIQREQKWLAALGQISEVLTKLEGKYRVLGDLSAVANGNNKVGLTFQRFVLGALLDDVTIAATERLKVMSRGRYQLQRTMDRAHKRAAGGLELEVFDNFTGLARGVATLSGGESFLASLSLALGLADVVQAYAGGIHLDTIIIDEGFGTLDPETLD
ncbi:MAG: SbcC/MukB-like Walker B domain-containing protein, partial [Bacillota bacterium]|nr:SbcC/MukB-like Walker B domain-containing protein [Bacillota bacterium]